MPSTLPATTRAENLSIKIDVARRDARDQETGPGFRRTAVDSAAPVEKGDNRREGDPGLRASAGRLPPFTTGAWTTRSALSTEPTAITTTSFLFV